MTNSANAVCTPLHKIASAYNISDEQYCVLEGVIDWARMLICGPDPILAPKRSEDPVRNLLKMAEDLLHGILEFRQRHRLNLAYMDHADCDLCDADNNVTDMIDSLDNLVIILKKVPLSKKGRPDIRMRDTIQYIGNFWKYIGRNVSQNFDDELKIPEFARFVCDIVECNLLGVRGFDPNTVSFSISNQSAKEARSRIESQIKYVVADINNGRSKRTKTKTQKQGPAKKHTVPNPKGVGSEL